MSYRFCIALSTVLALPASPAWGQSPAQPAQPPALVQVVSAKHVQMAPTVWLPGAIVSRDDARVAAEVAGRLVHVADIGQRVDVGEPLASIDDTELKLERAEAEAVVLRERAKKQFAEQELNRLSGLVDKGLVTRSRLDQARAERDAAHGEWRATGARLDRVLDRLSRTTIRAPFAGVVAERYRRLGEHVDAGDEVVRLVSPESREAQVQVPPASLPHVTLGTEVRVKANPAQTTATVQSLVPVGDDRSRLYEVRLALRDNYWPVGTTVRVAVPTAKPREVVAVPRDALVLRLTGVSVFRVGEDGRAQLVPVQTGVADGAWIEVVGDLGAGDAVVTRGGERLRPGQPIQVMPAAGGDKS
jgi:RND family efflux transporter MFP subunit